MTTPTKQHDSDANRQTSERERLAQACDRHDWVPIVKMCADQLRADEAEIAQLTRLVELRSNEAVDNLDEAIRLRAENEALRTVTEDDAEAAFYFFRDRYGSLEAMHATLQSFIRSKESRRAPE